MVGLTVCGRKGVFKCTPKGYKNQKVTAGRLLAVLDIRPSTTIQPTSNEADSLKSHTNTGTIRVPKLPRRRAQTPNGFRQLAQTPNGSIHIQSS